MGNVVSAPLIVDGVVQARSESVRGGTLDMARAEVMRGPQSTTLGTNALAGAISLVSNQPVFDYQASGSATVGSYSLKQLEAVLNVPLADNQAARIAYSTEKRNGYISAGAGDSDLTNLRAKYRWQPTDNLNLVFTHNYQNIGGNGVQQGVLLATGEWKQYSQAAFPALGFTGCANNPGPASANVLATMGCPVTYIAVTNGVNFRQRSDAWNDGFPPRSFPINAYRDTNINTTQADINWTTDLGTLTFIPSIQRSRFLSQEPPRGTSFMAEDNKQLQTIGDLRFNSKAGGKFEWQAGFYYSYLKQYNGSFKNIDYPGGMGCAATITIGTVSQLGPNCYSFSLTPLFERKASNAYFFAKYSVIDKLRLIAGYRYNNDSANVDAISGNITGADAGPDTAAVNAATHVLASRSWKKGTYRAGVEFDFSPAAMVYAVYNTGYNPGALDAMNTAGTAESTLKQSTLGFKTQLLDNRLQFNGEFFFTTFFNRLYEGTSTSYINGATSATCSQSGPPPPPGTLFVVIAGSVGQCAQVAQNAATVPQLRSRGLDLDVTWLITPNDRLTVTAESLKATYDQAPVVGTTSADQITGAFLLTNPGVSGGGTVTATQRDQLAAGLQSLLTGLVGKQLQNAPKWSATLDYQHTFTLGNGSRFTPRISGVYKQKYWSFGGAPGANIAQILADESNPANLAWQQAYTTWDTYATWEKADGKFTVTGYMKNLGNKVILGNYTDPYVSLQAPKTYGLTLSASF
jgi:iron complex outermembrane receptor protein